MADSDTFKEFFDDDDLKEKYSQFSNTLNKYSNCNDTEEDGYDIDDLIAIYEETDEDDEEIMKSSSVEIEAVETEEEEDEQMTAIVPYKDKNSEYKLLSNIFGQEYIEKMKSSFLKRCAEAEKLNLTYWKRSKQFESFNESNIKAPNFESSTRQFVKSSEEASGASSCNALSPTSHFKTPFSLHNPNGSCFPPYQFPHMSFNMTPPMPDFRPNFNQQQMYNVRVREVVYDYYSVTGSDISQFNQPNQSFQVLPSNLPQRQIEYRPIQASSSTLPKKTSTISDKEFQPSFRTSKSVKAIENKESKENIKTNLKKSSREQDKSSESKSEMKKAKNKEKDKDKMIYSDQKVNEELKKVKTKEQDNIKNKTYNQKIENKKDDSKKVKTKESDKAEKNSSDQEIREEIKKVKIKEQDKGNKKAKDLKAESKKIKTRQDSKIEISSSYTKNESKKEESKNEKTKQDDRAEIKSLERKPDVKEGKKLKFKEQEKVEIKPTESKPETKKEVNKTQANKPEKQKDKAKAEEKDLKINNKDILNECEKEVTRGNNIKQQDKINIDTADIRRMDTEELEFKENKRSDKTTTKSYRRLIVVSTDSDTSSEDLFMVSKKSSTNTGKEHKNSSNEHNKKYKRQKKNRNRNKKKDESLPTIEEENLKLNGNPLKSSSPKRTNSEKADQQQRPACVTYVDTDVDTSLDDYDYFKEAARKFQEGVAALSKS